MFTFIRSDSLEITFDPVDVIEKSYPSVSFDIKAIWTRRLQKANLELRESWLAYDNLDEFFTQIRLLKKGEIDRADLFDMGNDPIINFVRNGKFFSINLHWKDNFLEGSVKLEVEISEEELGECIRKIEEWEKWW